MRSRLKLAEERGTTLVEVLVATATGLVVLSALTMVIVVSLHGSARVSARVHATQSARVVVARIVDQLHSACVAPKVAPVQAGSSGTSLGFLRAAGSQGSAVAPIPTYTVISLSGGVLTQTDYAVTGTAPTWTPTSTIVAGPRPLMSGISPVAPSTSIFSYYAYKEGVISALGTPLDATGAATVVEVRLALTATPDSSSPIPDKGAPAAIQSSAVLRLTPPSFNSNAVSLPCR